MRTRAALLVLLLTAPAGSGCLDLFSRLEDHRVARTPVSTSDWNTDGLFTVQVREPEALTVRIRATAGDGRTLHNEALSSETLPPVELAIPDGTWTITYWLGDDKWETFKGARFDSTPPTLAGLETIGAASGLGTYTIGEGAIVEPGASVQVVRQATGEAIATTLPHTVTGLESGIHAFDVVVRDQAGNEVVEPVQVRAGSAAALPEGSHTLGLVARYTMEAEMWDITELDAWATPAQAREQADGQWLGDGRAIEPDDAEVRRVVGEAVGSSMTAGEAAFALFQWMAGELDYDQARLEKDDLLEPAQTIANGGGVCRDLAALYVSLLRAAGVPARLVTGYLGGEVDGFHAWVEFYGGAGHGPSPWVPVDVSAINGPYKPETALQAFGLRHTAMMPLRTVAESEEEGEWSTAVAVNAKYPADQEPQVELGKVLRDEFPPERGVLCVDPVRLARLQARSDCPAGYPSYIPDFVRSASQILDYGADVASAASGTTVTVTLSYPDPGAVLPGSVEQRTYGAFFTTAGDGTKQGTWRS